MSPTATAIVLALSFGCFVLAAFGVVWNRINLLALGLALWVLVPFWTAVKAM